MRPRNNILIVVATLLISAQTSPPNIGRGTFSYNPNSIAQNERILRLFLRLASHTANRLIYLKNEAKQREESQIGANANNVPELRIGLTQKIQEKQIANRGYNDQSGDLGYYYGRDPRTTTYTEPSRNRYDLANKYSERVNGVDISTTDDILSSEYTHGRNKGPHIFIRKEDDRVPPNNSSEGKKPGGIENRLFNDEKNNYVTNSPIANPRNTSNTDARINKLALTNQPEMSPSVLQDAAIAHPNTESLGLDENNRGASNKQANTVANNQLPVNASNVPSLFESENQSGKPGPAVQETLISAPSTLQSNINGTSAVQGQGRSTGHQSSNATLVPEIMTTASNLQTVLTGAQNSMAGASITQKAASAASDLQFGSTGLSNSVQGLESNRQNAETVIAREILTTPSNFQSSSTQAQNSIVGNMIAQDTMTAVSNLHSGSMGLSNSVQDLVLNSQNPGGGIAREAMNTDQNFERINDPASNGQKAGAGIAREAITVTSNLQSGSTGTQSSDLEASIARTMVAVSNLQSRPTGLLNSVQSLASTGQSAENGIPREAMTAISNVRTAPREGQNPVEALTPQQTITAIPNHQSGSTRLANSVQEIGSKDELAEGIPGVAVTVGSNMQSLSLVKLSSVQVPESANQNQAVYNTAEMSSSIKNPSKSDGILSNVKFAILPMKYGQSLVKLNETISGIRNIGTGTFDSITNVPQNGGSKSFQENQNSLMSAAGRSTEKGSQVVGLIGSKSTYTKPLDLERGEEINKTPIEQNYQQRNLASAFRGSDGERLTQTGSSLISTIPLFGSFPGIKDLSRNLGMSNTAAEKSLKDVPSGTVKNSRIEDLTIADEGGVSEAELQVYANQFANALRPIWARR